MHNVRKARVLNIKWGMVVFGKQAEWLKRSSYGLRAMVCGDSEMKMTRWSNLATACDQKNKCRRRRRGLTT